LEEEMSKTALLILGCAITMRVGLGTADADTIPPNCTLDPFTHKMNCPITPNCTLDPFTHTMNCHPTVVQGSFQSQTGSKRALRVGQ
jgi:hypothetical protein